MKLRTLFVGALMLMTGLSAAAEDKKPDFISQLMAKMTVEEKLGQLNLLPGTWAPTAANQKYATLKEAMEKALAGRATLSCAQGCNFTSDSTLQKDGGFYRATPFKDSEKLKREAIEIAKDADVIVCAMGESAEMSGESSSRATLEIFDVQKELLKFYDHNLNYVLEPGEFEIMIGQDSSLKHLKKAILIHN